MASFTTTPALLGGVAFDRPTFRPLLPDFRLYAYAAGLVDPMDANTATLELVYQLDDTTVVVLGADTFTGAGARKFALGPFDVFNTPGVPRGETVPIVRLRATKSGGTGLISLATVWARFLPQTRPGT